MVLDEQALIDIAFKTDNMYEFFSYDKVHPDLVGKPIRYQADIACVMPAPRYGLDHVPVKAFRTNDPLRGRVVIFHAQISKDDLVMRFVVDAETPPQVYIRLKEIEDWLESIDKLPSRLKFETYWREKGVTEFDYS